MRKVNSWLIYTGSAAIFVMMMIDVINRTANQLGYRGVPSGKLFIEEFMVILTAAGLAYVLFEGGHTRTEFVKKHFSPRLDLAAEILAYFIVIIVSGCIVWRYGATTIEYFQGNVIRASEIPLPRGPFALWITFSFLNLALSAILLLINEFQLRIVASGKVR